VGDTARQIKEAFGSNGHLADELAKISSLTGRFYSLDPLTTPSQVNGGKGDFVKYDNTDYGNNLLDGGGA